ncbi:Uncharacterized protein MRP8 [Wickerhamiella sorbophila]|uniref:Uncharacterized protein MRP8 n=1 Tax=Wickerhamiella sorbophila TaxID=45607 RepID=A0A2T0FLV5_9ASCO|nr:Uncharacterized protein MRP8 [Wickerhamiella sorbophila]PRT55962.1 Uncharacterized protein MRP8 [Wickerhamiella sorbophila]
MSTAEIAEIKAQIKKMQNVIAMTGRQIVELQLDSTRRRNEDVDRRTKELRGEPAVASSAENTGDYATNSDIVELVQELQDQLDILDERSIRRTINSRAGKSTPIVSLPSIANEYPDAFPHTLLDFAEIGTSEIERLARFYELLPPDAVEMEELLQKVSMTAAEAGVSQTSPEVTESDGVEHFNKLARFLGLPLTR